MLWWGYVIGGGLIVCVLVILIGGIVLWLDTKNWPDEPSHKRS